MKSKEKLIQLYKDSKIDKSEAIDLMEIYREDCEDNSEEYAESNLKQALSEL